jgi:DNA polymerase-1
VLERFVDFNPDSPDQTAQLLFDYLELGAGRKLARTPSGSRISTGKDQLENLRGEHPVVGLMLEYRQLAKLQTTYVDKLPRIVRWHEQGRGCVLCGGTHWDRASPRVHCKIVGTRTATGRYASRSPNQQTLPVRTALGREVRASFVAGVGKRLALNDYSQIELRLLAHLANERKMIEVFEQNGDIHLTTAAQVFETDEATADQRRAAKAVNFGIVYGETPLGLAAQLGRPVEWCEDLQRGWFGVYQDVEPYIEQQHYRARRYQFVWDMFGGVRRIPGVRSVHEKVVARALREAGNDEIQGSAAGIMKLAMVALSRDVGVYEKCGASALMTVHDEVIHEVDEDWGVGFEQWVRLVMEDVVELRVPVVCEGKVSVRWEK